MAKTYSSIPISPLNAGASYAHPPAPAEVAHLEDAAINVMTDFKHANAFTIGPESPLLEATMEMRVCHTHMLFVTDPEQKIIGLITTEDILGEKPLKVSLERQIRRSDILVRMVMTRQPNIVAIDINDLRHAKVGNIVETLHELKQHYALVIETDKTDGKQIVRGLFSLWDISKRVGEDLTYDVSEAHTLSELQHKIGE